MSEYCAACECEFNEETGMHERSDGEYICTDCHASYIDAIYDSSRDGEDNE